MDEEIHRPPLLLEDAEGLVHRGVVGDVALDERGDADLGGERLDALLERLALVGEGDLGALVGERLGDAPGDRVLVGDAHDEAALAGHQVPQPSRFLPSRGCGRVLAQGPGAGKLRFAAAAAMVPRHADTERDRRGPDARCSATAAVIADPAQMGAYLNEPRKRFHTPAVAVARPRDVAAGAGARRAGPTTTACR